MVFLAIILSPPEARYTSRNHLFAERLHGFFRGTRETRYRVTFNETLIRIVSDTDLLSCLSLDFVLSCRCFIGERRVQSAEKFVYRGFRGNLEFSDVWRKQML